MGKFKTFFFWLDVPQKHIWEPFWWLILLFALYAEPMTRIWWWLYTPFILFYPVKTYYLWWIGWDIQYFEKTKWIVLEVVPPKEILAPFTAFEDVLNTVWSVMDKANWREIWCSGELPLNPYWASWEIESREGTIHFYIRCLAGHRHVFESSLYAHYPDMEIKEVSDYVKNVPSNTPNEEWDMHGEDYTLGLSDVYPIRTFSKFFEPQGERISAEEKRLDPIASLLEAMGRIGSGENIWLQYITTPVALKNMQIAEEAKSLIGKLSKRPVKKELDIVQKTSNIITGLLSAAARAPKEDEEMFVSPAQSETTEKEMVITPGEREILSAVEEKIKKPLYQCTIRGVYVAKRKNWNGDHGKITRAYFAHFATNNLNHISFWGETRTKIHYIFRGMRKTYRQRLMFYNYLFRFPPLFPVWGKIKGTPILNSEELATMFHFPTKITGVSISTAQRVEAKKGGPPPDLPIE